MSEDLTVRPLRVWPSPKERSLLKVFLSLGLYQSPAENEDSPELLQACTSCNDNISLWIFWDIVKNTPPKMPKNGYFHFLKVPLLDLTFLWNICQHSSRNLQYVWNFSLCKHLCFLNKSPAHRNCTQNCTLHVGIHKVFTAPGVGTSYIVKCNVPNMYIPYNVHYTTYAYTTPIRSIHLYTALYNTIQPFTGLYRQTQHYTAPHISSQPYTTQQSTILVQIAYATLYQSIKAYTTLYSSTPVNKGIYDIIQPYINLYNPVTAYTSLNDTKKPHTSLYRPI